MTEGKLNANSLPNPSEALQHFVPVETPTLQDSFIDLFLQKTNLIPFI